jgi:chromosomal replication initiator protein
VVATSLANSEPIKQSNTGRRHNINAGNTFDSFIEGPNSVFAKNAALNVSKNPGSSDFNPLIIYGGVGLGKTHLLHSIANTLIRGKKQLNVVLASSEKFTNDFIASIQENRSMDFSKVYRKADVLLIDDIQFFQGKEQTQEQFFHTFNDLFTAGKQIVMTADRYPGEMVGLQDRLLSRFESGLHADIQPPDFETRVAILSKKAQQNNVKISSVFLEKIASHVRTNIRDLESCVTKIFAHATFSGEEISEALVESIIRERLGDQGYAVSQEAIVGQSRRKNIAEARQVAAYLAREVLDMPLNAIGLHLGGRDHTTVMHSHKKVTELLKRDDKFKRRVDIIYNELNLN